MNRSPFFYVGDKYKLMKQIVKYFPDDINRFFEPFVGGGSSFLNTKAKNFYLNDIDKNLINLHQLLLSCSNNEKYFFQETEKIIKKFNLSYSYKIDLIPNEIKNNYPKTYYAKFNKIGYEKLRKEYNENKDNELYLYILLVYSFNRMLRFNSKGDFNTPVGNVDFNNNVLNSLKYYFNFVNKNNIFFYNMDYLNFLEKWKFQKEDFIYFDPPYLISNSEYNKLWDEKKELQLLNFLDKLNKEGIKFAISNLIYHKGKNNFIFNEWSKKYNIIEISSNYISYHDNSIKNESKEILVINYEK